MSNITKKKTAYTFTFPSEFEAKKFLDVAINHYGSTLAQHPFLPGNGVVQEMKEVIVVGTDSLVFDMHMLQDLTAAAECFSGVMMPAN